MRNLRLLSPSDSEVRFPPTLGRASGTQGHSELQIRTGFIFVAVDNVISLLMGGAESQLAF